MMNLIVLQHRLAAVLLLLLTSIAVAQDRYEESFKVGKDVIVSVDVSYADVVFETWNKDMVEVEAFVDSENLSAKEKEEIFENWNLDVLGNSKKVVITSNSKNNWQSLESLDNLEGLESWSGLEALKSLESLKDLNWNITVPDIPNYKKFPSWPFSDKRPSIKSGNGYRNYNFNDGGSNSFDTKEYEKNKQKYVDKLNKKYDTNVSVKQVDSWLEDVDDWAAGFEDVMEDWGEKFGREFNLKFGPEFEKKMEAWGESFGKSWEEWGENFGKEMEKWGESFGKDVEKWAEQFEDYEDEYSKQVITDENGNKSIIVKGSKPNKGKAASGKVKKKIIIRMPKGTKTDINVRYGDVKMADVHNINATLNYTSFIANSIDGGKSLINASYAPVAVNNWNEGVLKVNYVEDCKLNTVKEINLQANSSDVSINLITENANLSGSFGNLYIYNVSNNFGTIDIDLDNTDATMKIPDAAFSFYFNGKKSTLKYPKSVQLDLTKKDGNVVITGFNKSKNSKSRFNINANYSNVSLH
jgi:hypothetical protein